MVKIKTTKQLNLPQLIEYAWDNDIRDKGFESERTSRAYFDYDGYLSCTRAMEPTDTFTVTVEQEITEDTRLDKLVVRYRNDDIYIFPQERIDDFKNDSSIVAFYIPNNDLTMTLIWRDGKLVE